MYGVAALSSASAGGNPYVTARWRDSLYGGGPRDPATTRGLVADSAGEISGPARHAVAYDPAAFAELIAGARQRDEEAFAELYRFAVRPVYRYLAARIEQVETVEELTEEVFLGAFSGIGGLRSESEGGVLAWLFQIARHKLADHLRRRYRGTTLPLEAAGEIEDRARRPDELAAAAEERLAVREAIEQLTPEQREVIIAKYVLDYDNAHTAQIVGKNANAVNQLHHRALASLHRLLAGTEALEGRPR
jgi:RNA polymerase sigma-70 factor (ECF subfamily)